MRPLLFFTAWIYLGLCGFAQTTTPLTIGEVKRFTSTVLKEDRELNIYLPAGYHPDSNKTYPVIYILDGSLNEDFLHLAGLVQFSTFPWVNWIKESIVVGIANVDRKRDFTFPTTIAKDKADFPTTGGSSGFISCLEKEIIPIINTSYKTNTINTLIGQSLGGLLATELLYSGTTLFQHYIIISPSLWWDKGSLLKRKLPDLKHLKSVYIGVGKEGKTMERSAQQLYKTIRATKTQGLQSRFEFFKGNNHANILHQAVYNAFQFMAN